jgi:hypothetical protein
MRSDLTQGEASSMGFMIRFYVMWPDLMQVI